MTPDLCFLSGVHYVVLTPPICQHHSNAVPGCPRSIGRAKYMLGRELYGPPSLDINENIFIILMLLLRYRLIYS